MTVQKIAEFDLYKLLVDSLLIESKSNSHIWFTHLNLCDSIENKLPDSGQIADYFFSNIKLPEIKFFLILIDKKRIEKWTDNNDFIFYQELIEFQIQEVNKIKSVNAHKKRGCVWKDYIDQTTLLDIINRSPLSPLESIAKNRKASIVQTNRPFKLGNINISKPWGYETWYTGIEKRGVVNVLDENGKTELPYSLNIFKQQILGDYPEELILLKKLNPYAEDVVGDLYYEMHEKKWEVYIVTEIDESAWPEGVAIIKAGINPKKITEYKIKHDKNWKYYLIKDFKEAINEYENLRRKIDNSKEISSKYLFSQESELREKAANFVGDCYVKKGDIVSFPPFQIHSLQHGIKVIEFQTPHYERLIVMFGQKELTQEKWDSEKALDKIIPKVYKPPQLENLYKSKGILLERFVDFSHFTADRLYLEPEMIWQEKLKNQYQILIAISGQATILNEINDTNSMNLEEAFFLPKSMGSYYLKNTGDEPLICLKAMPK